MTMTKKNFTNMAIRLGTLRFELSREKASDTQHAISIEYEKNIANFFKIDNPNFDEERFLNKINSTLCELIVIEDKLNR